MIYLERVRVGYTRRFGTVIVAGFLAKVGDLSHYDHGKHIIRLAGLNVRQIVLVSAKERPSLPSIDAQGTEANCSFA